VNPNTERELGPRLEDAIAALRYGGVAVNTWSSALFGLGTTTWGAYPGNHAVDVGSGIGLVGNSLFLDHPQKSVAYGTFLQWPKPPWWPGHRSLRELGRRWTEFEAAPGWTKLAGFGVTAARG
jgi:aldehyde dehydrogenase (NAD(P)+)